MNLRDLIFSQSLDEHANSVENFSNLSLPDYFPSNVRFDDGVDEYEEETKVETIETVNPIDHKSFGLKFLSSRPLGRTAQKQSMMYKQAPEVSFLVVCL